jgi:hypothetical protein
MFTVRFLGLALVFVLELYVWMSSLFGGMVTMTYITVQSKLDYDSGPRKLSLFTFVQLTTKTGEQQCLLMTFHVMVPCLLVAGGNSEAALPRRF